jgi:hypothetical protein
MRADVAQGARVLAESRAETQTVRGRNAQVFTYFILNRAQWMM